MNFLYVDSRYNFLLLLPQSHLILCGGTRMDEQSFKDFIYKLIIRVPKLEELDEKEYIGDGILIRKLSFPIHLNVSAWNTKNFKELSQNLFDFCTSNLNLHNYHFIDINNL